MRFSKITIVIINIKLILVLCCTLCTIQCTTQLPFVNSGIYKWEDHPVTIKTKKESRKIIEGQTTHFEYLKIHASTQHAGASPGKAHANAVYEECIIVKEGRMKIEIEGKSQVLETGGVVLLMPQQVHQIENVGNQNLTYYVMQYKSRDGINLSRGLNAGGSLMLNRDSLTFRRSSKGGGIAYFDRPTAHTKRFEMHITHLNKKGLSHKPHAHEETEIILMLTGEGDMIIDGKQYHGKAGDFFLMESNLQHGVSNSSDTEPCSYFAFKWQ